MLREVIGPYITLIKTARETIFYPHYYKDLLLHGAYASNILTHLYSQSCLNMYPISSLNFPYIAFHLYFCINTI